MFAMGAVDLGQEVPVGCENRRLQRSPQIEQRDIRIPFPVRSPDIND